MTGRDWPPHPARQGIGRPPTCPLGDRFTTRNHALNALTYGLGPHELHATPCPLDCGGWHNLPRDTPPAPDPPAPPAADCDATWQDHPDTGTPPSAGLLQLQELHDLRDQGIGPLAFRNADTITAEEYL